MLSLELGRPYGRGNGQAAVLQGVPLEIVAVLSPSEQPLPLSGITLCKQPKAFGNFVLASGVIILHNGVEFFVRKFRMMRIVRRRPSAFPVIEFAWDSQ